MSLQRFIFLMLICVFTLEPIYALDCEAENLNADFNVEYFERKVSGEKLPIPKSNPNFEQAQARLIEGEDVPLSELVSEELQLYEFRDDYIYEQLTDNEKLFYDAFDKHYVDMVDGVTGFSVIFSVEQEGLSTKDCVNKWADTMKPGSVVTRASMAYLNLDHPEVFWIDVEKLVASTSFTGNYDAGVGKFIGSAKISVKLSSAYENYYVEPYTSKQEVIKDYYNIIRTVKEVNAAVGKDASDYEKILYFNNWICAHNSYNPELELYGTVKPIAYTVASGLLYGDGEDVSKYPVCMGYTYALMLFCREAGIDCNMLTSETHAWNGVVLEGKRYIVDITFNDAAKEAYENGGYGEYNDKMFRYLLITEQSSIDRDASGAHYLSYSYRGLVYRPITATENYNITYTDFKDVDVIPYSYSVNTIEPYDSAVLPDGTPDYTVETTTEATTLEIDPVFDATYYLQKYPDLIPVYGTEEQSLYRHWLDYGMKEGRRPSAVYDYNYYISANNDLVPVYGEDKAAIYGHFKKYGMKEGRIASAEFNVKNYKNYYYDELYPLYGDDYVAYYIDYIKYGREIGKAGNPTTTSETTTTESTTEVTTTETTTQSDSESTTESQENILLGDANLDGFIDPKDASIVLSMVAGNVLPDPKHCDVNQNGYVDAKDASLILSYSAGTITRFD